MEKLTTLLQRTGRVAELALHAIRNLTRGLSSLEESPLSRNIFPLLNILSGHAFASQKPIDVDSYFEAIINLLGCCKVPEIACRYLEYLVGKFQ